MTRNGAINFGIFKRRRRRIIRAVPVARESLTHLDDIHKFRRALSDPVAANRRLWPRSRTTEWRRVKEVMRSANTPDFVSKLKALRHAFAEAVLSQLSLALIKKRLGLAKLETTEIYTSLIGDEERSIARLYLEASGTQSSKFA